MTEFVIEIVEGPESGRQVELTGPLQLGRDADAGLNLDDPQISRQHARIEPSGDGAVVADLGSTNGTFVNEQPVQGERFIRAGDRVRVGLSVLELRTAAQVQAQPSAVRPVPQVAAVSLDVLRPVDAALLPAAAAVSSLPPFGSDAAAPSAEQDPAYAALAALADTRVKRQTSIAVFAMLSLAALAVALFFGLR